MQRLFLVTAAVAALFLNGCANDGIEPDYSEHREAAPHSPDPMRHVPTPYDPTMYGGGGGPRI